jgi:hypothetical protein
MNLRILLIGLTGLLLVASEAIHVNSGTKDKPSLAEILTSVKYQNTLVYVYGSVSNEAESNATPAKWTFYYVPAMIPAITHPLMIDSLTAFIVSSGSTPVSGVAPYSIMHPNSYDLELHFACSSKETAESEW